MYAMYGNRRPSMNAMRGRPKAADVCDVNGMEGRWGLPMYAMYDNRWPPIYAIYGGRRPMMHAMNSRPSAAEGRRYKRCKAAEGRRFMRC